jgi:photosystem II stability/assembly factor-like uncharacterized protein
MLLRSIVLVFCLAATVSLSAQKIDVLTSGTKASLRGLSVVDDATVWVSGSSGTVGRSLDGGATWKWMTVKGFEKSDFRDIEAFTDQVAIIMAIAEPAYILKTTNGGESWKVVFTESTKGVFLDAMDFYNKKNGVIVGDPIDGKFYVIKTINSGDTWRKIPSVMQSKAATGEACFAASGTNIHYFSNRDYLFVSGGMLSRLHDDSGGRTMPIIQGKESAGANSIAARNRHSSKGNHLIVVGGDFSREKDSTMNCIITSDQGANWIKPETAPHGYRSCVEYINKKRVITCGLSGVDVSDDKGMNWRLISTEGFHVCRKAKNGKTVFLAGGNGKIGKLTW